MPRMIYLALAALAFACPDVPQASHWQSQTRALPSGVRLPALPALAQASSPTAGKQASHLRQESELEIVRYVSGEFARAVRPLPSTKKGLHIRAGQPVDEETLHRALVGNAIAANPGDTVQITRLEFRPTAMVFEINGGAKKHKRLRDRIQIEIAGGGFPHGEVINQAPGIQQVGATLILDFGGPVPDIGPDRVKQYLAGFLDFSKQRSPAVQWVETIPPQYKQAIAEKHAVVGMDREMVLAAMGPPDRKIRERSPEGVETEDWIYGQPPEKVTFVTFAGDKVIRVKQFN